MNQISTKWEEFRQNLLNSDMFKSVLDVVSNLLDSLNNIPTKGILALGATFLLVGKSAVKNFMQGFKSITSSVQSVFSNISANISKKFSELSKSLVNSKIGKKLNLSLGIDTEQALSQINSFSDNVNILLDENHKINVNNSDIQNAIIQTGDLQKEFKNGNINIDEFNNELRNIADNAGLTTEQIEAIKISLEKSGESSESVVDAFRQQRDAAETTQLMTQGIQQGITALTSTFTVLVTEMAAGADTMTLIKSSATTLAFTLGPYILQTLIATIPKIKAQLAGEEAITAQKVFQAVLSAKELVIMLAILAAVILIVAAFIAINAALKSMTKQSLSEKISEAADEAERLSEKVAEVKSELSDLTEESDELSDNLEVYDDLNVKVMTGQTLSDEEQSEWDDMIEFFNSEYPELITYYNEESQVLQLNNSLLEDKNEELQESIENQAKLLKLTQSSQIEADSTLDSLNATSSIMDKLGGHFASGAEDTIMDLAASNSIQVKEVTDENTGYKYNVLKDDSDNELSIDSFSIAEIAADYGYDIYEDSTKYGEMASGIEEAVYAGVEAASTGETLDYSGEYSEIAEGMLEEWSGYMQTMADITDNYSEYFESWKTYYESLYGDELSDAEITVLASLSGEDEDKGEDLIHFDADSIAKDFLDSGNSKVSGGEAQKINDEVQNKYTNIYGEEVVNSAEKSLENAFAAAGGATWDDAIKDVIGHNGKDWEKLDAKTQETLNYLGIDEDTWSNTYKAKNDEQLAAALGNLYAEALLNEILDADVSELLSDEQIQQMTEYTEAIQENPSEVTADEYMENYEEYKELLTADDKYTEEEADEMLEDLYQKSTYYDAIQDLNNIGFELADDVDITTAAALDYYFTNIGDDYEEGASQLVEKQKDLADSLSSITSDYSSDVSNAILSFDFSDLDSYESKNDLREALVNLVSNEDLEGALGEQEAEAFADEYIATLEDTDLVDFTIKSLSGVEQGLDDLFDGMKEDLDTTEKAIQNVVDSLTDEDWNTADLFEYLSDLNEAGDFNWSDLNDYVTLDESGEIQMNFDSGELLNNQVYSYLDSYDQQFTDLVEESKAGLEELKTNQNAFTKLQTALENDNDNQMTLQEVADAMGTTVAEAAQLLFDAGVTDEILDASDTNAIAITNNTTALNTVSNALANWKVQATELETWVNDDTALATIEAFYKESATDELLQILYDQQDELEESVTDAENEVADAEESLADAEDSLADAEKSLAEAEEKLADALEDYSELLYGSDDRASTLDNLYNYSEAINSYTNAATRAQDELSDASTIEEATKAWQDYAEAYHNVIAYNTAEQSVIEEALGNYADWIENATSSYTDTENGNTITINYSDYVSYDENTGKYVLDQQLLNQAEFNDDYKELLETQVENYNKYADELLSLQDEVAEAEKALQEAREQAYSDYASMEEEIASVLQEQYQDEIDALEEKYSAMEEADSDYLDALKDAIDKQRELRDQENEYEDLAQQERKLALMQRDTSGANQTEVMELEDEVEESRQDLLDEEVDNILDNMEEMNDNISELHETEIELKQAILDNTAYWNSQAEQIAASFTSADDYVEWMTENSTEFIESTMTQQIVLMNEWTDTATAALAKYAIDGSDTIESYVTVTSDEIATIVNDTGEALTTEVTRQANETTTQVTEDLEAAINSIDDARESVEDAKESVADAEEAVNDANLALSNANSNLSKATTALEEWNAVIQDVIASIKEYQNANSSSSSDSSTGSATGDEQQRIGENKVKADAVTPELETYLYSSQQLTTSMKESASDTMREGFSDEAIKKAYSDVTDEEWTQTNGQTFEKKLSSLDDTTYRNLLSALINGDYYKYASGGLVDYTGPAWVDGTPSSPEAFLSAEDTERIGHAAEILADLPLLNSTSTTDNINSTSYGDTTIEINLNIDSISSDVDIDNMIDLMKQEIVDAANPVGSSNILTKSY